MLDVNIIMLLENKNTLLSVTGNIMPGILIFAEDAALVAHFKLSINDLGPVDFFIIFSYYQHD